MSEYLRVPKYISGVVAAGIGLSALTGCGEATAETWEVGVVCKNDDKVQVASLDNDPYYYSDDETIIDVVCVDENNILSDVVSLELTKGNGEVINTNKVYTNTIEIKYEDQTDGYDPEIEFDSFTGNITTDNAEINSVAVK